MKKLFNRIICLKFTVLCLAQERIVIQNRPSFRHLKATEETEPRLYYLLRHAKI